MADSAHRKTDKYIEEIERKVKTVYKRSADEVERKMNNYLADVAKKEQQQLALLKAGKITQEEFNDWRIRKYAMGERWRELRNNISDDLMNADKIAKGIANGYRPEVYALNHNFALYQCEHDGRCSTVYQLYDRHTVERLLRENQNLMPPPGKRIKKALKENRAARWNNQHLQSSLTQGILAGDTIDEMAVRVAHTVSTMGYSNAVRYARTMMTGAQNAGRLDGYKHAEELGIELDKEWIATLDDRTRESHAELHGERVPNDEPFSNGLMYPGDPSGDPGEVYNCRCTMKASIKGYDRKRVESSPKMGDMSFDEWVESRRGA